MTNNEEELIKCTCPKKFPNQKVRFHLLECPKGALKIVLDFVERWNKKDEEKEVAEAAQSLERIIMSW